MNDNHETPPISTIANEGQSPAEKAGRAAEVTQRDAATPKTTDASLPKVHSEQSQ